ncbi:MAG TPA: ABC transporter permease [Dehalococcoidia bacterium]|nr:ABC transporter permease [Dehalococcoidia bacterium]
MAQEIRAQTLEAELFAPEFRKVSFAETLLAAARPWLRRPMGIFGLIIVFLAFFTAIAAPVLAPFDAQPFVGASLESPNGTHLLGTNNLGQDVLSRTIYGAQVSMAVGFWATFIGVAGGTFLGIVSGYFGGWLDLIVQRIMEVLASFPGIMLALIVVAALGRPKEGGSDVLVLSWQLRSLSLAISLGFIFGVMRVIRSAVLKEKSLPYVEAAVTLGASTPRIMFRHILPNVFPFVIVTFTTIIGAVILIEAGISFLGYGVSIGTPSWGLDLSNRNREYFLVAPWVMAGPATALTLTVLGFNFLGDTLRDILDPRLRGSR